MAGLAAGAVWAGLIAWFLARAMRQLRAHRQASLGSVPAEMSPPPAAVSIIVPVRNEIGNIADCLAALSAQRGLAGALSIIVVDDDSADGTAAAAARAALADPRIEIIAGGRLPAGWTGKPHACWRGALRARGAWLCFIDADVRAAPELVATALAAAERQGIAMLSLNPFQQLGSFWERLIIPAGLVLIACTMDLAAFGDPRSAAVSANGQFILIRREAYFAVGGHAAVAREICEDKALAALVKCSGRRFRMLGAEHLAQTRMYADLAALWGGLAKNATEILGDAAATVAVATLGMMVAWATLLVPTLTVAVASRHPSAASAIGAVLALAGSAAVAGLQIGTARHFRIPLYFGLLFPYAYSAVAALAWHSALLRRRGRVTWKGRAYDLDRTRSPGKP